MTEERSMDIPYEGVTKDGKMTAGEEFKQEGKGAVGESLPLDFKERMKRQLGSAYGDFIASYDEGRTYGLRYNPLKIEKNRFLSIFQAMDIELEPVEWAEEGFYYPAQERPGRLALHEAGAYYIQEPSAMAVVQMLDPKPGENILDLCAAPGGKSTQIAGRMRGSGVLMANERIPSRAKTLSRNIERMGITNAIVLQETPEHLAERFPLYFDRIVVDAPCSGEGMFRKDLKARQEWSAAQVEICAKRQREILSCGVRMLKPGGILVYSTCTFAPPENEGNTQWLTMAYPDMILEECRQIWPHQQRGEGHYAARFCKAVSLPAQSPVNVAAGKAVSFPPQDSIKICAGASINASAKKEKAGRKKAACSRGKGNVLPLQLLQEFFRGILKPELAVLCEKYMTPDRLVTFADHLYLAVGGMVRLDGLKVERAGLQLGSFKTNRFEPSHALAMALWPEQVNQTLELDEPERYLRGEPVSCGAQKGWTLVTVQGCSVGWGKAGSGILKNHYPKGLRRNL